jgi:hypothetical protein
VTRENIPEEYDLAGPELHFEHSYEALWALCSECLLLLQAEVAWASPDFQDGEANIEYRSLSGLVSESLAKRSLGLFSVVGQV